MHCTKAFDVRGEYVARLNRYHWSKGSGKYNVASAKRRINTNHHVGQPNRCVQRVTKTCGSSAHTDLVTAAFHEHPAFDNVKVVKFDRAATKSEKPAGSVIGDRIGQPNVPVRDAAAHHLDGGQRVSRCAENVRDC